MAELESATKRLDQSEGGKNALVDQVSRANLVSRKKHPGSEVDIYLDIVLSNNKFRASSSHATYRKTGMPCWF